MGIESKRNWKLKEKRKGKRRGKKKETLYILLPLNPFRKHPAHQRDRLGPSLFESEILNMEVKLPKKVRREGKKERKEEREKNKDGRMISELKGKEKEKEKKRKEKYTD